MTNETTFELSPNFRGEYHVDAYNEGATKKATELLQLNIEKYAMMFLYRRHNHLAHQVLTAWALGASATEIQEVFDRNTHELHPKSPVNEARVKSMEDWFNFNAYLHVPRYYCDYLEFFQRQVKLHGVKAVLEEHLFADDEHAYQMLGLWYGGIMHPFLHLGFAVEFNQPALIAEALAQACIHEESDHVLLSNYLLDAERASNKSGRLSSKTLLDILDEVRSQKDLREAHLLSTEDELDKIKPVLVQQRTQLTDLASQYTVNPENVDQRIGELVDVIGCLAFIAPPPPKPFKVDFFFLHSVNGLIFLPAIMRSAWISEPNKMRLIEWFGRYNIVLYASRGAPRVRAENMAKVADENQDWNALFRRGINNPADDSHLIKMLRALKFAEEYTGKANNKGGKPLVLAEMWLKLANIVNASIPYTALESHDRWEYNPFPPDSE